MNTKIGNIICNKDCIKSNILNVADDITKIDDRFPTLIIGWENVKSVYPGTSILDWKIDERLFWTHHKNVKRSRYEEDIEKFKELCLSELGKNIIYDSINLFSYSKEKVKALVNRLSVDDPKYCFVTDQELYVYPCESNVVYGLSVYEIEYYGFSKFTFLEALKRSDSIKLIYHDYDIPFEIKDRIQNKRYLVPYLIYLFDGYSEKKRKEYIE